MPPWVGLAASSPGYSGTHPGPDLRRHVLHAMIAARLGPKKRLLGFPSWKLPDPLAPILAGLRGPSDAAHPSVFGRCSLVRGL